MNSTTVYINQSAISSFIKLTEYISSLYLSIIHIIKKHFSFLCKSTFLLLMLMDKAQVR